MNTQQSWRNRISLSLLLWTSLATAIYFLVPSSPRVVDGGTFAAIGIFSANVFAPAVAMVCLILILHRPSPRRIVRISWWFITLPLFLTYILFAIGRLKENRPEPLLSHQLLLAWTITSVALLAVLRKKRPALLLRTFGDLGIAAAVPLLIAAVYAWTYEAKTTRLNDIANQHWAEIGRPMNAQQLRLPIQANDGLAVVKSVFQELFDAKAFKGERWDPVDSSELPPGVIDYFISPLPPADVMPPYKGDLTELDKRSPRLKQIYAEILRVEPPIWPMEEDFLRAKDPNFLASRHMAQLFSSDVRRHVERGEFEDAANGLRAGFRLSEGLSQNPQITSMMIHVAIDSIFVKSLVRLPADIAVDAASLTPSIVAAEREKFLRSVQMEARWLNEMTRVDVNNRPDGMPDEMDFYPSYSLPFPKRLANYVWGYRFRRLVALSSKAYADMLAILADPISLTLPDLGMNEWEQRLGPNHLAPNFARATARMEAGHLFREQTELIRRARAALKEGRIIEDQKSTALPHVTWKVTCDPIQKTVSMKLDPLPPWLSPVAPPDFWHVPLDGSKSWQF